MIGAFACLVGCATPQRVAVLEPVGPAPGQTVKSQGDGVLQVYSARKRMPSDVNREVFFEGEDFGENGFLLYPAHTDYAILSPDGKVLRKVHNAADLYDPKPATVSLPPGCYKVQAKVEDYGRMREPVEVPVLIKPGQTTAVHLAMDWHVPGHSKNPNLIRWSNGQVVGWRAPKAEPTPAATK
jgi:hypothetical protein